MSNERKLIEVNEMLPTEFFEGSPHDIIKRLWDMNNQTPGAKIHQVIGEDGDWWYVVSYKRRETDLEFEARTGAARAEAAEALKAKQEAYDKALAELEKAKAALDQG